MLRKTMNKDYRIKEMEDVQYFLLALLEHVFTDTGVYDNPFTSTMACLEKRFSCKELTGSTVDSTIIYCNVWPSDRDDAIDLESLLWGTFGCNFNILGRKGCVSCVSQRKRLNVQSFVKTLKSFDCGNKFMS